MERLLIINDKLIKDNNIGEKALLDSKNGKIINKMKINNYLQYFIKKIFHTIKWIKRVTLFQLKICLFRRNRSLKAAIFIPLNTVKDYSKMNNNIENFDKTIKVRNSAIALIRLIGMYGAIMNHILNYGKGFKKYYKYKIEL